MAFEYAYSLDGVIAPVVKDLPLDTLTNYQNTTGTNGVKKGDLVFLDGTSGLVKRAKAGVATVPAGVLVGKAFTGLVAAGQEYAATNSSFTADVTSSKFANGQGKVNIDSATVYRVPASAAANASHVGKAYGILNAATGDQTVNLADTTTTVVKVIDYATIGGINYVYVTLKQAAVL